MSEGLRERALQPRVGDVDVGPRCRPAPSGGSL
jgi:hypothetical protein